MTQVRQKVVLCILDGWGVRSELSNNGIAQAKTPHWDGLLKACPHTTLEASELFVGLPKGQMGNSEVGHMTIGSGRVVMQDLPRIDQAMEAGSIPSNPHYTDFLSKALEGTKVVHVMGLLSPGGVHSHQDHMAYMAKTLAQSGLQVKVHAFLDGRDTPPMGGAEYLSDFLGQIASMPNVSLGTFGGRYFAMDRDKRWDRVAEAYAAMVDGQGALATDAVEALKSQYTQGQGTGDEFIPPHVMAGYTGMNDGDALVMVNFRADRVRQILTALLEGEAFKGFHRSKVIRFSATLGMTEYSRELKHHIPALFEKQSIKNTLGEVVAHQGLKQLRLAETEKYAHVTFFLNGGREHVYEGEERQLIQSPSVATYDLKPEMSAPELTDYLVMQINADTHDLIVVNYANTDMVGHSGIQEAIIKAVETVDTCLGRVLEAVESKGYALIITADHGNVELMVDPETGQPHTAHTLNPVPFVLVNGEGVNSVSPGTLQDISPTVLSLMGIPQPQEMTGKSLVCYSNGQRAQR